ncbi:MAG TPA: hypothetical protein VK071_13390 [Tissierellales bacterium]|nr:hypothetical protein [Tissierellales bacterium]
MSEKNYLETNKLRISKAWYFVALIILLSTTLVTGTKVYQSAINYQGKLSWFIHELKIKRKIEFVHDNIYHDSLEGLFEDIQKEITLPEELYVSTDFRLKFNKGGQIISLDTFLYGKDQEGETQSFLITYDRNKGEDVTIYLNGYVDANYNEEKKLQPLMDLVEWILLEETVSGWSEEQYEILYTGFCNWGYNSEGIVYIDENGETKQLDPPKDEIVGYTVSVYVPHREESITPIRFIHNKHRVLAGKDDEQLNNQWDIGYSYNEGEETFFLDENLGYQLSVVDAALGSRFYALLQTQDGGYTWETINSDPFLNNTGVSSGITYINKNLGFIGLSYSGGSFAELYRTEDGGLSFEKVYFPKVEVRLNETETYNPFDFPEKPFVEDGKLYLLVGQGQDGDYKGGIKALYQSEDNGETWEYIKEVQ